MFTSTVMLLGSVVLSAEAGGWVSVGVGSAVAVGSGVGVAVGVGVSVGVAGVEVDAMVGTLASPFDAAVTAQ
ncbi:hypothetical protein F8O03_11760 [Pseudoclavibacter terrae]|uniref:Uncharacterized protein n=1 Tax=Pseudoclavibacter terrae TaxID=1530195 RepID=A0A7J5B464_9MICO|nr:hypothetical protein F8O03_11760 [Pseudoclavibacter terrae]